MNLELIIPIVFGAVFGITMVWAVYRGAESPGATQLPRKPTCMICVQNDGEVKSVYVYKQVYGSPTYKFHMGCVVDAVCNPDKYDGRRVDYALKITDAISVQRQVAEKQKIEQIQAALQRKSECKKACKRIRDENLLPS